MAKEIFLLKISGQDKPGLTSGLTGVLAEYGAKVLDISDKIGNFSVGNEADFIQINLQATPLIKFRLSHCQSIQEILFVLNTLGDDRLIDRTYSLGKCVYSANS